MTTYETVSVVAFDTAALRTVVPIDAYCVRSTRVFDVAWSTAHVSDTGFHERTFVVRGALDFYAGTGQRVAWNTRLAVFAARNDVRVPCDAVAPIAYQTGCAVTCPLTLAKFDAHRFVVLNLAFLPGFARIPGLTGVDARSVDAGPFRRALVTVSTSNFVTADKLSAVSDAFSFGASGRSTIGY